MANDGSGSSVLVVEDDAALRLVCRVNFELEGLPVREAGSLAAARAAVAAERPGVVVLDLHLGTGTSDALLDELGVAGIPVVLMSGTHDLGGYVDRVAAIVSKPFDPADLVESARRCLRADG